MRDKIIALAKEAGIDPNWIRKVPELPDFLERFAHQCEARGYERGMRGFAEAVDIEREECANIVAAECIGFAYDDDQLNRIIVTIRARKP